MNAWIYVAGWVLVHFVWQGAVVALAAIGVLHLCRRQAASLRYVIACGAMAMMLAGAVATAALLKAPVASEAPAVPRHTSKSVTSEVLLPIKVDDSTASAQFLSAARVDTLLPWIVSAWLFGVTLLLIRAGAGWWRVRRLHRLALSSMRSAWQDAGNRIASRLGLDRVIRIVELPHIDVPLVVGSLRPVIVLPIAAISQLDVAQVEAILAHELAHVRRHDYAVNLMQTVAETLLFYHPAVWWLSARIRDEREQCCDDVAVTVCGDPVGYAAALTELEAWRSGEERLAAAATGGSLLNRVRRLLRVEIADDSRTSPWTIGLVVATAGALGLNLSAQTAAPVQPVPTFEVASVRPNTGDNKMAFNTLQGARYNAINIPLRLLIMHSYGLQEQQLVGAPAWIASERFDIVAKADGELGPPESRGEPSRLQLMMRALLEERFKLKVHRESREVPVYVLVLARADGQLGKELKPSAVDCEALAKARRGGGPPPEVPKPGERPQCGARVGFGELAAGGQPLLELVSLLSANVGRSVIDRTGLTGRYDMHLRWTPDRILQRAAGTAPGEPIRVNGVEIDPNGPSIFTALQEQLGLKLEAERGTVEALVIDHVERPIPD
jgi:uncharacterized protein (TIGR03435 family)